MHLSRVAFDFPLLNERLRIRILEQLLDNSGPMTSQTRVLTLSGVSSSASERLSSLSEPQSKDVDYFQHFLLSCLPRNLELLCQCLSFFANLCVDNAWRGTYEQLETVVQSEMVITYGGPLKPAVIRRFVEFDDL